MKAAILAIGSELLGPERLDTNSLRLTAALERWGIELVGKAIVGDDEDRIADEIRRVVGDVDLLIVGGGLGPNADDITRPSVAKALGRTITIDEARVEKLRQRYKGFGRPMPEVNRRQAEVIDGATVLENPQGSAPAQRLEADGTTIFLFPAVPGELTALIDSELLPWLTQQLGDPEGSGRSLERTVFKIAARAESEIEELLAPFYERFGRRGMSILASTGEIQIHLADPEKASDRLAARRRHLHELLGDRIFTDRAEDTLEEAVGRLLRENGRTITTAESCTGGLVAQMLTRISGSSAYFLGGVVSYTNELKSELLGVEPALFESHGAVSEPVARAMAEGVRERTGSDHGIGITGVAGPTGGTPEKPVGTVHIAVAGPDGTDHRRARFPGDRERVRLCCARLALEMLRRQILGPPEVT